MDALAIALPYVLFVWWFSTGAVLVLVGVARGHRAIMKAATALAFVAALSGIAVSSRGDEVAAAYCAFTCAILLWGTIELTLLSGWITGPRPEPCPRDCAPGDRIWYALQAIAYHELALIVTAGLVFAVTRTAPNPVGWWTFLALLILRQSAKINLFLGVRTLNDELLPEQVGFLKSYFSQRRLNALFPVSVVLASATAVGLAAMAIETQSQVEAVGLSLLAGLVALGALEHWFMVLPMPVVDLWRWAVRSAPKQSPAPVSVVPAVVALPEQASVPKTAAAIARQRLEDQFREAYYARQESPVRMKTSIKVPV